MIAFFWKRRLQKETEAPINQHALRSNSSHSYGSRLVHWPIYGRAKRLEEVSPRERHIRGRAREKPTCHHTNRQFLREETYIRVRRYPDTKQQQPIYGMFAELALSDPLWLKQASHLTAAHHSAWVSGFGWQPAFFVSRTSCRSTEAERQI